MGNFLTINATGRQKIEANALLSVYKWNSLKNMVESLSIFRDAGLEDNPGMDFDAFDVCFGHWLGDVGPHYQLWKARPDAQGTTDAYTVFAGSAIHCERESVASRVAFILQVFDLNGSNDLSKDELHICITACIRGMLILARRPNWELKSWQLSGFVEQCFKECDLDQSGRISVDEFTTWVCEKQEIVDYLVEFTSGTDMGKALARRDQVLAKSHLIYQSKQDTLCNVSVEDTIAILKKTLPEFNMDDKCVMCIFGLLEDKSRPGYSTPEAFSAVARSLVAFALADTNGNNLLDWCELRTLLWLVYGAEPTRARVDSEVRQMSSNDNQKNEYMTLPQWLQQISTETRLDILMDDIFNRFDPSGKGVIDLETLKLLTEELMIANVGGRDMITEKAANFLRHAADALALEICDMTGRRIGSSEKTNYTVEWTQLKTTMHSFGSQRLTEITNFAVSEHCEIVDRYMHFDKDGSLSLNLFEIQAALYQRLQPYVICGRISATTARREARATGVHIQNHADMDRNGEIDFSELRVQSERIISVETQMMARVLKPRQPELLLRRLRRARTKLNDAAGLLSMIKKDAFAGKTSKETGMLDSQRFEGLPKINVDITMEAMEQKNMDIAETSKFPETDGHIARKRKKKSKKRKSKSVPNTPRPGHTRSVCVRLVAKPNEATPQSIPHSITAQTRLISSFPNKNNIRLPGIPYMGTVVAAKKSTIQRSLVAKPKTISLFEEAQAQTSRI